MANDSSGFYNWYRRYKVRDVDMNGFQQAMVEGPRGFSEGLVGPSILQGFEVSIGAGLSIDISSGISAGASGYLGVINTSTNINANAATGSLPSRSLVVVSPSVTGANYIVSPTSPFASVPLNNLQKSIVKIIPGTPGQNPDYPAKGVNDAIICGIILRPGVTQLDATMIDFEVKEIPASKAQLSKNQSRYDDRLRPYRYDYRNLAVKPSQSAGSDPVAFAYSGKGTPSLFPLTAGAFVNLETYANFVTGMISGGDATSPSFTPVVPTGSNSIICVVTLTRNDTLNFTYGTQGTYAQCMAAIRQQTYGGAGGIPAPDGDFVDCYVVVNSIGGVFSDIQVFDARPFLGSGSGAAKFTRETPAGDVDGVNNVFTLSSVPADPNSLIFWVDQGQLFPEDYTLVGAVVTITNSDFIPAIGQSVDSYFLKFGAVSIMGGGGGGGGGGGVTGSIRDVHGSATGAVSINPSIGLLPTSGADQVWWVQPLSGSGAVSISAVPPVGPGVTIGQRLSIKSIPAANYLVFPSVSGFDPEGNLQMGPYAQTGNYTWDGVQWSEDSRRV